MGAFNPDVGAATFANQSDSFLLSWDSTIQSCDSASISNCLNITFPRFISNPALSTNASFAAHIMHQNTAIGDIVRMEIFNLEIIH